VTPATATWVNVLPAGGTSPGTLNVSLTAQALQLAASAIPYTANVAVTCLAPAPCAGNAQNLTVNLKVVNAAPALNVQSDLVSFTTPASAPQAMSQNVGVQNAGGGSIGIGSFSCAASWCSISGVPGSIGAGVTVPVTITADPGTLNPGYYRTTFTLATSAGTAVTPVTLFIAPAASMALQPSGVQYQALVGGSPSGPPSQYLLNVSSPTPVSWSATVLPGASWLTLPVTSGMVSSAQPSVTSFSLNPGVVASLAPKTYYGTIRVTTTGSVNSPQDFQVVLNVAPLTAPQRPNPSPAGLLFITASTATPPPQTVTISTNAPSAAAYQVSASTTDGAAWLAATPSTGSAAPGSPGSVNVSVDPSRLNPGVYYGGVNFAFAGVGVRTVTVTLIVASTAVARSSGGLTSLDAVPGCTPTAMVPAQMGLLSNFSAPTSWPTPISIQLLNNCGGTISNGQIVATFSNGDPPLALNLADVRSGLYAGTWTPRKTSSQVSISARASAPGFPAVTAQLAGAVTPNAHSEPQQHAASLQPPGGRGAGPGNAGADLRHGARRDRCDGPRWHAPRHAERHPGADRRHSGSNLVREPHDAQCADPV